MNLTKERIVDSLYDRFDITKKRAGELVESLLEIMKSTLEDGEDVLISGFGKFCVKDKSERRGRNPQTGEDLMLGSRKVIIFRCSGVLRDKINTR